MRNNTVILIKNLAQRGLMHMFGANVFNKIISFSGTILLVRILSKGEYGVYAYKGGKTKCDKLSYST